MRDKIGSDSLSPGDIALGAQSTRYARTPVHTSVRRYGETAHQLEALEPRLMLSTTLAQDPTLNQLNIASVSLSVSATWFQDLEPDVNSSDSGVSVQVVDGASTDPSADPASETGAINHQWLIQLTDNATLAAGSVTGAGDILGLSGIGVQVVRGLGQAGLVLVDDSNITPGVSLVNYLNGNDDVAYIASNYQFQASSLPDDTYFSSLWGLNNTGQFQGSTTDADIDAPEAWAMTSNLQPVVIAVIDTGVDYTHPDLAADIWTNPGEIPGNGIDDDHNGFIDDVHGYDFANNDSDPMDDYGHGTHVAGTIAATPDNNMGVAGIALDAQILALKFISSSGTGSTANAIRALNYATMMDEDYGVNIVATNNSWGGAGYSVGLYNAIKASGDAGILFITSAGNDATNIDVTPEYPASYGLDNVITVAATTWSDQLASFSNYGSTSVDIGAPGEYIRSTLPGNTYGYYSGTSMAAPHVSGAVALYKGEHPDASMAEVKNAILQGGDSLASLAGKTVSGKRLNLVGMLQQAPAEQPPDPTNPTPPAPDPIPTTAPPDPLPAADIALDMVSDPLPDQIFTGESQRVELALSNVGDLTAKGKAQISFYLSTDDALDGSDILVLQKNNVTISLRAGQSRTDWFTIKIPDALARGDYHLIAVAQTNDAVDETNTDNNIIVSEQSHELVWEVGDVDGRRNTSLILPDSQGQLVRFTLTGAGTATISGTGGAQSIVLTGTDTTSKLTLRSMTNGQTSTIGDILVSGSIGSLTAKNVTLNGDLTVQGDIRYLTLGDITAGDIQLGQTLATRISLGNVTDTSLASDGDIRTLTAYDWLNTDSIVDSISAASIRTLSIRGDMAGNLTTTDANASAMTATIRGNIETGEWQIAADIKTLRATGSIDDFMLTAAGSVSSIRTGSGGHLAAMLQARYFGNIYCSGEFTGSITATDSDSRGWSIRQILTASILNLSIDATGNVSRIRSTDNISNLTASIAGRLTSFRRQDVQNLNLTADSSLGTFSVYNWSQSQLTAGHVSTISVRNDLDTVTISLTDTPDPDVVQPRYVLSSLRVQGTAGNLDLSAAEDINQVSVGAITDSYIHVGVASGTADVLAPVTFGDTGSIRTFTVRGLHGVDGASFSSSVIQVRQIGSVSLQEVQQDEQTDDGVVASSVDHYSRHLDRNHVIRLSHLSDPSTADQAGSFILRIV